MAVSGVNTSGISVGSDGKLKISGFASGIDWQSLIDAQIKAKRAPAVVLENNITKNNSLVTAYGDFKTKATAVTTALNGLRGGASNSADVFATKSVTGTTAAVSGAPAGFTPSSVTDLLVASVSNSTQSGTHTLKINSLATANQVRTDAFASTTDALSTMGVTAGTITVGGKSVVISATDSLVELKSKINNAGAGVSATIVSSDSTHNYLVLTSTTTGVANQISFGGSGTTNDSLGLTTTGGTVVKNTLVSAADANIDVDGITGITRSTNEISDVISGITFSLVKAEPNTTITLKIEPDLTAIKTGIQAFVDAYNGMRDFVTAQRTASDLNKDGTVDPSEVGPLAYDQTLRDAMNKLSEIASTSISGAADGYSSLGQIGIVMGSDYKLQLDSTVLDSKLLSNTADVQKLFTFQSSVSDSRMTVLDRSAATASGTYYVNIAGTDASGNVTSANIRNAAASGAGGADDGSVSVNARTLSVNTGDASGLQLFFNGGASMGAVNDASVTISRGVADQFYDYFSNLTKTTTGGIDTQVTQLQTQNTDYTDRISVIDGRLDVVRTQLTTKFTNMETALSKLQSLQTTIDNYTAQLNKSGG